MNKKNDSGNPILKVSDNKRYLENRNGEAFFWLGGTSWGMSEWLTREEIIYYLDNRKEKDFSLVQVCVFWGKRKENPISFTLNPPNAYGFKAFTEENGIPNPMKPASVEGGTVENPNDYWDHVEFILNEARKREMIVALLPVWGRRYVNASSRINSVPFFSIESMTTFGAFLGERFKNYKNIIWVLGGDVKADEKGDYLGHYRAMVEGIITGLTGEYIKWNENSPLWDKALMTYHPDGSPFKNSSTWFHDDRWLDFNMIETHEKRDSVYQAVYQDFTKVNPVKPTVMGEPAYEGSSPNFPSEGIHMRRQAFQSFFAGASGFTYGGKIDHEGNGPLWSPYKGWKKMLDMEGANSMRYVKQFCLDNEWPNWIPDNSLIIKGGKDGEFQKVAVRNKTSGHYYIYFPDNSPVSIDLKQEHKGTGNVIIQWFNPSPGAYINSSQASVENSLLDIRPPEDWNDAVLILKF